MRRLVFNPSTRSVVRLAALSLLIVFSLAASAQSAGYDLFQTGSGSSVTLPNIGAVALQGVAIQGSTGNADTIIHRTTSVPAGGGNVSVTVAALFMKSTNSVTVNGQSADVYVTVNNSQGLISTSVLPQPDSVSQSSGSLTVNTGGTFNSSITVNADVIFVKAGTSVTNSANWLSHGAGPSATMTSTNSTWSTSAPSGYPANPNFPSGGFFPITINGHLVPPHVHPIVVAKCGGIVAPAGVPRPAVARCIAVAQ